MVDVLLNASVQVRGGPNLTLRSTLEPESYSFASIDLEASGTAGDSQDVPVLPSDGTPVLLVVNARKADGTPATVTVTPKNGAASGSDLEVEGHLAVANADVLDGLVTNGPRSFTIANTEATLAVVDVFACLAGP